MPELPALRTYTSKTLDNGDGSRTLEAHAGHIHFKDALGNFSPVDYTLIDQGTFWELTQASYRLRIAKSFGAPALIQFTNKYEGADHVITYEPTAIYWVNADNRNQRQQFRAAQAVTGTLDPATNTITYANAFGSGVDFQVQVGRSGIRKWIVANSAPPAAPYANAWLVPVFKWDAQGLTLRSNDGLD